MDSLAVIQPGIRTGFSNGGWNLDRYPELEPLQARTRITVADLQGPGVIRQLHCTRHRPAPLFARGIVLEIWFDDAEVPAVSCPLADFFGDGCNSGDQEGSTGPMDFSANLIECAPWSYNSYFTMPFKVRARVCLRNDTDQDALNYSYVEWEPLPEWRQEYGYFHATYQRKAFRLLKDTDETFFEIQGTGHIIGRQFSIVTDDPAFEGFAYVMEGNNEVDIDGRERAIDYLGSEDSFGFSWGYPRLFAGRRAGITLMQPANPARLSVYRFHDHLPIRFSESLHWHINWGMERHFHASPQAGGYWDTVHKRSRDAGGCWVDYATVHYWYQDQPGGYAHQPLHPMEERIKEMLHPNLAEDQE